MFVLNDTGIFMPLELFPRLENSKAVSLSEKVTFE